MSVKIDLNFDKPTISKGILEILANNLKEDPDRDVVKMSLKDSLAVIAKGNKLNYGAANQLLMSVLRILNLEDSAAEDEIIETPTQATQANASDDLENTQTRSLPDPLQGGSKDALPDNPWNSKSDKQICKFYANGKCRFNTECRFSHPKICQKLRQHGISQMDPKGCDGKCNTFHPNVCRSSLSNKTCSYKECRFFHIKGTKTVERTQAQARVGRPGPDQQAKQHQKRKNSSTNSKSNSNQNQTKTVKTDTKNKARVLRNEQPVTQQVFRQEKSKLDNTLEMIMRELSDIRNWQKIRSEAHQPNSQPMFRPQTPGTSQANHIPVGPQMGSQWSTQDQHMAWNSPNY